MRCAMRKVNVGFLSLYLMSCCFVACSGIRQLTEAGLNEVHEKVLSVDSHEDTPIAYLADSAYDFSAKHNSAIGQGCVDIPRMIEGKLDAAFMAAFIWQGPLTAGGRDSATAQVENTIKAIHAKVKANDSLVEIALTPADAYRLKSAGKRAIFIGVENGYAIGTNLNLIKKFYDMGVRYITLCHVKNNDICTSSTDSTGGRGLSEFGRQVVAEMNRTGMMIDVSHISDEAFFDVINITTKPVIASHSCVRALCDTARNMSDRLLQAIKRNNGVVQICFVSEYLKVIPPDSAREKGISRLRSKYGKFAALSADLKEKYLSEKSEINIAHPLRLASVSDMVDHIDHVVKVIGIDYVGIGTDFDGGGELSDCRDASQMKNITIELARRGYNDDDIAKIWGGNIMRVMKEVQRIAD